MAIISVSNRGVDESDVEIRHYTIIGRYECNEYSLIAWMTEDEVGSARESTWSERYYATKNHKQMWSHIQTHAQLGDTVPAKAFEYIYISGSK